MVIVAAAVDDDTLFGESYDNYSGRENNWGKVVLIKK